MNYYKQILPIYLIGIAVGLVVAYTGYTLTTNLIGALLVVSFSLVTFGFHD